MKRRGLAFFLTTSTWILVLHDSSCSRIKLQCLCTECPKAVCTSHYGCYIDVKEQKQNHTHAWQRVIYGCIEENNMKMCKRHERKGIQTRNLAICCSNEDLCNMPLLLKDVIERKHKKEQAHWKRRQRLRDKKQSCPEVEPAIQLASVILPSILIAVVFLISFLLFMELIRHRKFYVCEKPPEDQISPKSKCKCLNRGLSNDSTSSNSDSSKLTLSSLLVK